MTRADELLALAARIEALTGPDREVDCRISLELSGTFYSDPDVAELLRVRDEPTGYGRYRTADEYVPAYTASLDAAMTLVPEGWRIGGLSQHDHQILREKGEWGAWLYPDGKLEPVTGSKPRCHFAATAPLALTAAALRALAAIETGAAA